MSYWKRLLSGITGKAKQRLPDEMALLGAPQQLVEKVRRMSDEKQEEAFVSFVEGKHACMLDWKAQRGDVFNEVVPLLTVEEKEALPDQAQCPDDAGGTIALLRQAISPAGRTLVQTESLGDFSFLIVVSKDKEQEFKRVVGPWLISGENA
ncbi:MAG TPA: hypothetical protein VFD07_12645 [Candidatus Krumholzibacteria bacterium]|nr:hypothetical protein [Candidatus Krumholzibacteria bacterium]